MDSYRNQSATLNATWVVYGSEAGVSPDDSAESYHEASTLYPSQLARQLPGIAFLESSPQLQLTASRSTKRHPHLPALPLPPGTLPDVPLGALLARRRTRPHFAAQPLPFEHVALLLRAAYGITGSVPLPGGGEQSFRAAPSAGALFPLEIYPLVFDCVDLAGGCITTIRCATCSNYWAAASNGPRSRKRCRCANSPSAARSRWW
jgi:hypothetical protein